MDCYNRQHEINLKSPNLQTDFLWYLLLTFPPLERLPPLQAPALAPPPRAITKEPTRNK